VSKKKTMATDDLCRKYWMDGQTITSHAAQSEIM